MIFKGQSSVFLIARHTRIEQELSAGGGVWAKASAPLRVRMVHLWRDKYTA